MRTLRYRLALDCYDIYERGYADADSDEIFPPVKLTHCCELKNDDFIADYDIECTYMEALAGKNGFSLESISVYPRGQHGESEDIMIVIENRQTYQTVNLVVCKREGLVLEFEVGDEADNGETPDRYRIDTESVKCYDSEKGRDCTDYILRITEWHGRERRVITFETKPYTRDERLIMVEETHR